MKKRGMKLPGLLDRKAPPHLVEEFLARLRRTPPIISFAYMEACGARQMGEERIREVLKFSDAEWWRFLIHLRANKEQWARDLNWPVAWYGPTEKELLAYAELHRKAKLS